MDFIHFTHLSDRVVGRLTKEGTVLLPSLSIPARICYSFRCQVSLPNGHQSILFDLSNPPMDLE